MKRPLEVLTEVICPACDGTGFQKVKQPTQPGRKIYPAKCTECLGKRSLPTTTVCRVDSWPPVSASKNSVPGGTVSSDKRPVGSSEIRDPERQKTPFRAGPQLLRVQSERLELPAPFCRSITKSFDSDAAR